MLPRAGKTFRSLVKQKFSVSFHSSVQRFESGLHAFSTAIFCTYEVNAFCLLTFSLFDELLTENIGKRLEDDRC